MTLRFTKEKIKQLNFELNFSILIIEQILVEMVLPLRYINSLSPFKTQQAAEIVAHKVPIFELSEVYFINLQEVEEYKI